MSLKRHRWPESIAIYKWSDVADRKFQTWKFRSIYMQEYKMHKMLQVPIYLSEIHSQVSTEYSAHWGLQFALAESLSKPVSVADFMFKHFGSINFNWTLKSSCGIDASMSSTLNSSPCLMFECTRDIIYSYHVNWMKLCSSSHETHLSSAEASRNSFRSLIKPRCHLIRTNFSRF